MIPAFKENDYYRGFDNAVDAVIQAAAGEYKADPIKQKKPAHRLKLLSFLLCFLSSCYLFSEVAEVEAATI